jgi:hypothetical protein
MTVFPSYKTPLQLKVRKHDEFLQMAETNSNNCKEIQRKLHNARNKIIIYWRIYNLHTITHSFMELSPS